MIDPLGRAFRVAVEHRGVGSQSQAVGRAMHGQPGFGVGLAGTDLRGELPGRKSRPRRRAGSQPGRNQRLEDRLTGRPSPRGKPGDFHRGECLQVQMRKGIAQRRKMPEYQEKSLSGCNPPTTCSSVQPAAAAAAASGEQFVFPQHTLADRRDRNYTRTAGSDRRRRWWG